MCQDGGIFTTAGCDCDLLTFFKQTIGSDRVMNFGLELIIETVFTDTGTGFRTTEGGFTGLTPLTLNHFCFWLWLVGGTTTASSHHHHQHQRKQTAGEHTAKAKTRTQRRQLKKERN